MNRNGDLNLSLKRKSGIELLRILAACAVVVLHYNGMGKALSASISLSHEILSMLECICVCAVDLFVMISGYFLCTTQKRTWDKPIYLLLLLSVIRLIVYFAGNMAGGENLFRLDLLELVHTVIPPKCYFILLYITLYIISPYINIVMKSLTIKGRSVLVVVSLLLFSVYPTLIDSYQILIDEKPMGVSNVGAWGQQHGYTIVAFVLFYIIAAWIRMNEIGKQMVNWKVILLILGSLLCIFCWFRIEESVLSLGTSLIEYNALAYTNPFVLLLSALLLILFSNINFQSRIINTLAKATFVCYIFHLNMIPHLKVVDFAIIGGIYLFVHLIISVVACYLVSWIVWYVLDNILKPITKKLGQYKIYSVD